MRRKYHLRYLPSAHNDLLSIFDWISADSPKRALSFVDELDVRIGALEEHPFLGRLPRHRRLRTYGYHVLIVESYLVFYIVRGQTVEIHRVVHGSRDLNHLI